jgi:4-amino-4-deoxy-L-arabinose transferase-like glycosyltransferase
MRRGPRPRGPLRDLFLAGIGAAALFVPWSGARDLWNPNEPTYGQAVAEMVRADRWLLPTVNGEVFAEKPILYFWLARGAAGVLGGVSELALRLPSAASGIALVLLVHGLVLPYAGRGRARLAAALAATTFVVFWSARQVQMDLLLAACVLATVVPLLRVVDHGLAPAPGAVLAGLAAGLGVLAKGPVGLVCPGLILLAYAGPGRLVRALQARGLVLAAAACCAVAAPWFALLALRGETEALRELLLRQNLVRFVAPWDHEAPWWYYLQYFWIDMAPWSLFVPLAWGLEAHDEGERRLHRLAWTWLVVVVAFFSLAGSKRSPYILPVAPAVAVLASAIGRRWWRGELAGRRRTVALALHGVLAVAFVAGAGLLAQRSWPAEDVGRAAREAVLALAVGGAAVAAGLLIPWRARLAAPCALALVVVALYGLAARRLLPAADAIKSPRPFGEAIAREAAPDRPVRGFHAWKWRASWSFYAGRPIPNLETVEALRAYWQRPERVLVVVERGRLAEARAVLGSIAPLAARTVGGNEVFLFANRPAELSRPSRARPARPPRRPGPRPSRARGCAARGAGSSARGRRRDRVAASARAPARRRDSARSARRAARPGARARRAPCAAGSTRRTAPSPRGGRSSPTRAAGRPSARGP